MNKIQVFGISHKTVNLNEIGQFHVSQNNLQESLEHLKKVFQMSELVYLATCNRLEFIFYGKELLPSDRSNLIKHLVPEESDAFHILSSEKFYHFQNLEAVRHLFKVSASLDSAILGEGQIFGQLKKAYSDSRELSLTGDYLRLLFQNTVESGKEIYTKTEIKKKPVSVASVAYKLTEEMVGFSGKSILFIGAGETIQLISKYVGKRDLKNLTIANRTLEKAENLAKDLGGKALPLSDLFKTQASYDIIITCTSASEPILTKETIQDLNGDRPLFIVDLAVPNDVCKSVQSLPNITYLNVEDIKQHCNKNAEERKAEITKADQIIDEYILKFKKDIKQRRIETAFSSVPQTVKELHSNELEKIFKTKLRHMNETDKELLEEFVNHLAKKVIQIPMKMAKEMMIEHK